MNEDNSTEWTAQEYLSTAQGILNQIRIINLLWVIPMLIVSVLVGAVVVDALIRSGSQVTALALTFGGVMLWFVALAIVTNSLRKSKAKAAAATRPGFEDFFNAWVKERDRNVSRAMALFGLTVVAAGALHTAKTVSKDNK